MKFRNSAFNAQGSRIIIVLAKVRTVKIYVAAVRGGAHEKGKRGRNSVYHQNW
jgi:hypothetical protein